MYPTYYKSIYMAKLEREHIIGKQLWMEHSTRPTHRRTDENLYPPERQLTKASEPSFDLEGGVQGQIQPHQKIPSQ